MRTCTYIVVVTSYMYMYMYVVCSTYISYILEWSLPQSHGGTAAPPMLHSPHHAPRQPSPGNKDRLAAARSVGPNVLGNFPPDDVLRIR